MSELPEVAEASVSTASELVITIDQKSELQVSLRIEVPAAKVKLLYDEKLKTVAGQAKLDGFRPGKVPVSVIKKRFGRGIEQEISGDLMKESYFEALKQNAFEPAGLPRFEPDPITPGQPFVYRAVFEVLPTFTLAGIEQAKIELPKAQVTQADVEATLEKLRAQHKTWEASEAPAKSGDQTTIDFKGFINGEAFEGGEAKDHELELGSGAMIPGFETQIEGHKAGESFTIEVTFPAEYHVAKLANQAAQFEIKLTAVKTSALPELDDAFLEKLKFSSGGGVDGLRTEIETNLKRDLKMTLRNQVKQQVFDKLVDANPIEIPTCLVAEQVERLQRDAIQRMGVDPAKYSAEALAKIMPADLFKESGERQAKLGILLREYIKLNPLTADPDLVESLINEITERYENAEEMANHYRQHAQTKQQIEDLAVEEQIVDALLATAKTVDVTKSFEQIMNPPKPDSDKATDKKES